MEFINAVRSLGVSKKNKNNDDLFVDRLNHKYTVTIIIIFALVVTLSQYGGNPINCWVPGHFTGNYANYAENICWVSSTYNVPLNEDLPSNESERKVKMLKYYQWTPFILLFQALLFYLPKMIWQSLNDKSGLDLQSIVEAIYNFNTDVSKYSDKQKLLNYLTNLFDNYVSSVKENNDSDENYEKHTIKAYDFNEKYLRTRKKIDSENIIDINQLDEEKHLENGLDDFDSKKKNSKISNILKSLSRLYKVLSITKGKRYGNYLLVLFVVVKVLYTSNSIIQLFMLNHFLGNDYILLGFEVFNKIWNGDDWTQLKRFPRITMCDFKIREVGIVHRYTVQCVLSINLFNEKIFIFLWFWLCLISFFNLFDLVSWSYTLIFNNNERYYYIKKRLTALKSPKYNSIYRFIVKEDKHLFKKFVNNYLREDGVLALRLLSRNSQDLIVSEIIYNLYDLFKVQEKKNSTFKKAKKNVNVSNGSDENGNNEVMEN